MKVGFFFLGLTVLVLSTGFVAADRLSNQTPENQIFSIDTVIDATGVVDSAADMAWLITSPGAIETFSLGNHVVGPNPYYDLYYPPKGKVISDSVYKDSMLTNGGKIAENKNFVLNTKNQPLGLYNTEGEKVLTYTGTEGAHMVGEEEYTLDVAGEAKRQTDNIRCVFSTNHGGWLPPFCNIVTAKGVLTNINSARISAKGQIGAVAETDDIPAELNYQIAVIPDANSGSGFTEGTVKTTFAGSVMEGRGTGMYLTPLGAEILNNVSGNNYQPGSEINWDDAPWALIGIPSYDPWYGSGTPMFTYKPSTENTWKDSSEVTGGIRNFQKAFAYKSGFKL